MKRRREHMKIEDDDEDDPWMQMIFEARSHAGTNQYENRGR